MKEDIFDSFIRESLADAEVKAPKGVWTAVSRRMGSASPRRHWLVYAALAGACAAVAAIFLMRPVGQDTPLFDRVVTLDVETPLLTMAEMPQKPSELKTLQARELTEYGFELGETTPEQKEAPVVEKKQNTQKPVSVSQEDPFASLMAEDAKKRTPKEPVSIKVGGVIGANDSHFSANTGRPAWASGYVPEGVEQNSVSTFLVPVSAGLSVRIPVANKLSVGVGVNWTELNRRFNGSYNTAEGEITHRVDYVGIPVDVYYNLIQRPSLQLYAYAGASAEKAVSSRYYIHSQSSSPLISDKVDGVQFGLHLGFGVSFSLSKHLALYFDPYLGYYIPGNQPKSLRTEHPLMVSFEAGLRFNL